MNEMIKNDILDIAPIEEKTKNITQEILEENDFTKLKDLINDFNITQSKKEALRILKYNSLLDNISDEMITRFRKHSDEFTNSDLLQYLQAIQNSVEKSNKKLNNASDISLITINQVNINPQEDVLDRESREKVADALKAIMSFMNKNQEETIEPENIVIEENEIKEGEPLLNGDEGNNNNQD